MGNSLKNEIEMYKNGQMSYKSYQFQLFVMSAHEIISHVSFYELSLPQINEYFRTVKFFTITEAHTIFSMIAYCSNTRNEANLKIKKIIPSVRCLYKQGKNKYYLSPCCCENLYNNNFKDQRYKLKNGDSYAPGNLFDFQSEKMTIMRLSQEKYSDPPQFQHHENVGIAFENNNLCDIYKRPIQKDENAPIFEKDLETPSFWHKNIFQAAEDTGTKSIRYLIYLIPELRNFQDKNGLTPLHYAAKNGNVQAILMLKKLNADFNIYDNNGNLPIHLSKNKETVEAFISCGCDFQVTNKNDQSLLELNSNPFKKDIIEFLIRKGFNFLKPNKKGIYWAQFVTHNQYFKAYVPNKDYEEFQAFIINSFSRSTLRMYKDNKSLKRLISRTADYIHMKNDIEDLAYAVKERDMEKIIAYVAIGTPLDDPNSQRITNLITVVTKNDMELVKIFASNFCRPNYQNLIGQSSFWLAASNTLYDISTLLCKEYNANPDIKSTTDETLMHFAYNNKLYDLVYYLLDLGASPNIDDSKGETVQYKAFADQNDELAEIIQDYYGGDINHIGENGLPLGHASLIRHGDKRLEYLIKRKLDVELKGSSKNSLFMETIQSTDDVSVLQYLVDNGANINTKDDEGRTPFYYTCCQNTFCREKFDLLLRNNCDINIQNDNADFPISVLIRRNLFNEVLLLLNNYNPVVEDWNSKTEPIEMAITKGNELILEKLIDCGATALNVNFPVVQTYLEVPYYKFETLKKMRKYNLAIGAPLQTAIRNNKRDAAIYMWQNTTDNEFRIAASRTVDQYHQTPLVLAIYNNDEYFMEQLIQPNFDLATPDKDGKTPLILLYEKEMNKWIDKIMPLLTIEEISAIDSRQFGALTYITKMGNKELIQELFLKGVNVFNVTYYNGELRNYIRILKKQTKLHNKVIDVSNNLIKDNTINHNEPNSKYNKLKKVVEKIDNTSRYDLLFNMESLEKYVEENI